MKLRFKEIEFSFGMSWRHKWGSGDIAWFILTLGTRWDWAVSCTCTHEHTHSHSLSLLTLCLGKEPWDTFSRRLVAAYSQFCCQLNRYMQLKTLLHCVLFLQDIVLTCQVQSIGYHGWGETVLLIKVSQLQLTQPSGSSARNFAAPIFRPEV